MDDRNTISGQAVAAIAELARKGQEVQIESIPQNPDEYLINQGGNYEVRNIPPPRRDHDASRIEDLAVLLQSPALTLIDPQPVVFYNRAEIVLIYVDSERRDKATVHLQYAPVFDEVCKLVGSAPMSQHELVDLLSFHLRGAVVGGEALVSAVRSVKFSTKEEGSSTLQHGSEGVDRSVVAELTGTADIPETFVIDTPIYTNPDLQDKHQIEMSLGIIPGEAKFVCRPFPGEIENAVDRQLNIVATQLEEHLSDVPIVRGCP